MNEVDIRKYAGLMEELGLTGLEITEDNKVVRLERSYPETAVKQLWAAQPVMQSLSGASEEQGMANALRPGNVNEAEQSATNYISVKSPIVGVFYAAPAENAPTFVALGDRVEKGKTLCIIEAMKLMNEINAEESGEIVEICVTNGQVVEYGTELFKIRR